MGLEIAANLLGFINVWNTAPEEKKVEERPTPESHEKSTPFDQLSHSAKKLVMNEFDTISTMLNQSAHAPDSDDKMVRMMVLGDILAQKRNTNLS